MSHHDTLPTLVYHNALPDVHLIGTDLILNLQRQVYLFNLPMRKEAYNY